MFFFFVAVGTVAVVGGTIAVFLYVRVVFVIAIVTWASYFPQQVFDIPVWSLLLLCSTDLLAYLLT